MRSSTVFLLLALCLAGCASNSAPPAAGFAASANAMAVDQYHIGVDDVVTVSVWQNEELSVTVPVRPDGRISMPLLGDVQAGGLTPQQVGANIKRALEQYIRNPHVVVILEELNSHEYLSRIRVTGAVQQPMSLPHRQGMSVLDAVLEAGGVTDFASGNGTVLYRRVDGETESIPVYLEDILEEGDLATNYTLAPGDVIAIPERIF
ncbi:MAG TPA: XrtA/PEP-CTERM system exopolysaccharide export protein [Gammaproteobacteria bacterium]